MTLHNISEQYLAIQDEDLPEDVIADTIEGLEGEFQVKAENIGLLTQNWQSEIEQLEAYKRTIEQKIKAKKNRIDSLKDYLRGNMEATGIIKIDCPLFAINCVQGRDMVAIDDESLIPDDYITVKDVTSPDKRKILEDLKQGIDIPGVSLTKTK